MAPLALPGDALKGPIVSARGVNREMVAVKRRSEQEQSDGDAAHGQSPVGWLGCHASGSVLSEMKSGN